MIEETSGWVPQDCCEEGRKQVQEGERQGDSALVKDYSQPKTTSHGGNGVNLGDTYFSSLSFLSSSARVPHSAAHWWKGFKAELRVDKGGEWTYRDEGKVFSKGIKTKLQKETICWILSMDVSNFLWEFTEKVINHVFGRSRKAWRKEMAWHGMWDSWMVKG